MTRPPSSDAQLEQQIDAEIAAMCRATRQAEVREHWQRAVALINSRSPEQVRRMDVERGLA